MDRPLTPAELHQLLDLSLLITDNAIVYRGVLEPGISFLAKPFTPVLLARRVREPLAT